MAMYSFYIASYNLKDDLVDIKLCLYNRKYFISSILETDKTVFNVENGSNQYLPRGVTLQVYSTKRGMLDIESSILNKNNENFAEVKKNLTNNDTSRLREGFDFVDFLKLYQMLSRKSGGFGIKDPKQLDILLDQFMMGLDSDFIYSQKSKGGVVSAFNKWNLAHDFKEVTFGNREAKYELTKNEAEYFLEIMNYRLDGIYTERRVDIISDVKKYSHLQPSSPFELIFNKRKPEDLSLEF